jgi:uncharacterized membrane protein
MKLTRQQALRLTGWGIPLAYAVVTVCFGMIVPRIEHLYLPNLVSTMSAPAAMSICSSISSGMIALTGIVFSLAFVMVQFSSTAYSPRLVLWVARDPVVSHALGMFSATFLYALIVLAWVDRSATGKVPFISGWLVFGSLLASMGMFVALIERVGLLQVNRMLIFTGDHGREAIKQLYATLGEKSEPPKAEDFRHLPVAQTMNYSGRPQVIQTIRLTGLISAAKQADAVIEMASAVGDTVLEMAPLLRIRGGRQILDDSVWRQNIEIGEERTFEQDPKYAIRLIVDIAIKALSPAINDPTTAVQALDQIEDLLIRLGHRNLDIGKYHDDEGKLRLIVPFPSWEDFLLLALDEIRFCGANSIQVMRRMNALIKNLKDVLPADRHDALQHWAQRLQGTVQRSFADAEEKLDASVADRQGLGIGEETNATS